MATLQPPLLSALPCAAGNQPDVGARRASPSSAPSCVGARRRLAPTTNAGAFSASLPLDGGGNPLTQRHRPYNSHMAVTFVPGWEDKFSTPFGYAQQSS
jgi:hypothetical protein